MTKLVAEGRVGPVALITERVPRSRMDGRPLWSHAQQFHFDFFVRKQARNRAPPLKDALRKVARDLRARVRTNGDAKN